MAALYTQFVPPGSVCFDVGANLGSRTKIFLHIGAKVVALEPQRACTMILRTVFAGRRGLTVLRKALGPSEGTGQLSISNANGISSMSTAWMNAVSQTGRFAGSRWNETRSVDVTTLDALIARYGVPSFIKIDVEGFEHEVLSGLSKPVPALSFEFTPEYLDAAQSCVTLLGKLGSYRFNYSLGESMKLELDQWVPARELMERLDGFRRDFVTFGDVYARLAGSDPGVGSHLASASPR
jgi:FkbM family methyltransferase